MMNILFSLKKFMKISKLIIDKKQKLLSLWERLQKILRISARHFNIMKKEMIFVGEIIDFSIENEKEEFINIKKIFNKNFFDKFKQSGNLDSTPIFILGMPRSGTTLVEQILSSHPKVFGGDELNFLPFLIKENFYNKKEKIFFRKYKRN